MIFGIDENILLIIALAFFGLSGLYYVWLWATGFIKESRLQDKPKQPWE
tara:strand:+ start:374 stop:520 length:147 start_codon:yes stop_codon:yes gene_type:complete